MRARQDAARRAARPILFTQALAIAAVIGLLISLAGQLSVQTFQNWSWSGFAILPADIPVLPLALVLGFWLVLAPVALYLTFSRD
jgi:hypothetical protein